MNLCIWLDYWIDGQHYYWLVKDIDFDVGEECQIFGCPCEHNGPCIMNSSLPFFLQPQAQ